MDDSRLRLLRRIDRYLDAPLLILGLLWLAVLIAELTMEPSLPIQVLGYAIWAVFIVEFVLKLVIAPDRRKYLVKNWFGAISLLLPALRIVRVFRVLRLLRYTRVFRASTLLRVISSINRAGRSISAGMQRRALGYVLALTLVMIFGGAAGMLTFERDVPGPHALRDYGTALWWTTMIITTMGTDYWPQTLEGRLLCLLLAIYGFAVFGYITANFATLLLGSELRAERQREREHPAQPPH